MNLSKVMFSFLPQYLQLHGVIYAFQEIGGYFIF